MNNNFRLDGRTIAILVLVALAAIVFLPRILGGNNNDVEPRTDRPGSLEDQGQGAVPGLSDQGVALGSPISAAAVNQDGCPTTTTENFEPSQPIYIVAPDSTVPAGTSVFVRLYYEGEPIEDLPEIRADREYQDTCINFVFEPTGGVFDTGQYEAQFIVNGNPADSVAFNVG